MRKHSCLDYIHGKSGFILVSLITLLVSSNASAEQVRYALNLRQEQVLSIPTASDGGCILLDTGNSDDLQNLAADIEISSGSGLLPEEEPAGSLLYTFQLVPEIKAGKVLYRGLLAGKRLHGILVKSRSGESLALNLVYSSDCN